MNPWFYVGAAAIAFGAGWTVQGWRWDASETARISLELEQAKENQRLTRIAVDKNRDLTNAYLKHAKVNEARANAGVAELDRLRNALAAAIGPSDPAARFELDGERIALLGRLLSEAAGLAEECRAGFARSASKTDALQTYIREVHLAKD